MRNKLSWDTPVAMGVIIIVCVIGLFMLDRGFRGLSVSGSASVGA